MKLLGERAKRTKALMRFHSNAKIQRIEDEMRKRVTLPEDHFALERTPSFIESFKNTLQVTKVKNVFRMGSELFAAAHPFIEKPTYWNAAKALISIGKVVIDDVEIWAHDFFDSDDWIAPYNRDFNSAIMDVLCKFPYQTLKTSQENSVVRLIDLGGVKAGWVFNTKLNSIDNIYVETEKRELARTKIKAMLWELYGCKPLVMRQNKRLIVSSDDSRIIFEVDDAFVPMESEKSTQYSIYLKRCIDAGVPRSVMLYGPPGTGKSTTARTLVEKLGLRSFRIRVEDVEHIESGTLFEAINLFEPDAIIFDDFDRSRSQAQLLEMLEFFQRHVKLVIATVNDKGNLDEAILRPGRFDELVCIDKMDEGVVKQILGEYIDGFDIVKDWPIAFINEYVKRRRFASSEEAANDTIELVRRVARLERYRDHDDMEVMNSVVNRNKKRKLRSSSTKIEHFNPNEVVDAECESCEDDAPDTQQDLASGE